MNEQARKVLNSEGKLLLDEYETKIEECHRVGRMNAEAMQNATEASQTFSQCAQWQYFILGTNHCICACLGDNLAPSQALEEANRALEQLKIAPGTHQTAPETDE